MFRISSLCMTTPFAILTPVSIIRSKIGIANLDTEKRMDIYTADPCQLCCKHGCFFSIFFANKSLLSSVSIAPGQIWVARNNRSPSNTGIRLKGGCQRRAEWVTGVRRSRDKAGSGIAGITLAGNPKVASSDDSLAPVSVDPGVLHSNRIRGAKAGLPVSRPATRI